MRVNKGWQYIAVSRLRNQRRSAKAERVYRGRIEGSLDGVKGASAVAQANKRGLCVRFRMPKIC